MKRYSINLMLLIIMSINSSFINQENPIEKIKKAIEITSPREIINLLKPIKTKESMHLNFKIKSFIN